MSNRNSAKRLCDWYIRRAKAIGVVYCVIPVLITFGVLFATSAFRPVYLLRLALSLVVGGSVAAYVNEFGLSLWLIKHRSAAGPATILDGMWVGAAIGIGIALVPPLTSLIATNHLEAAKTYIIAAWLASAAIGAVMGGILASIGRKGVERPGQGAE